MTVDGVFREQSLVRQSIAMMIAASLCYAVMSVLVKMVARDVGVSTVVVMRSAVLLLMASAVGRWKGVRLRAVNRKLMIFRSVAGLVALSCFFYAISRIPLANAVTLQYSSPIFVALFSGIFLRERVSSRTWVMIFVAFIGAALVLSPDFSSVDLNSLFALFSAIIAATAYLAVRALRHTDTPEGIVFNFSLIALVCSLPSLFWAPRAPQGIEWLSLIGVGFFAGVGQLLMTHAYHSGRAATVSSFSYATVLFSTLFAGLLFSEWPLGGVLLGTIFIVGAGVGVSWQSVRPALLRVEKAAACDD